MDNKVPIWEKQNLTIQEAAEYSNIGITKLYELTNNDTCPFVLLVGKKKLIKKRAFDLFIENSVQV